MLSGRLLTSWITTALSACLLTSTATAQSTWYVDDNAIGDPGPGDVSISDPLEDGSAAHPFDAIQEAVDVAASGDEVVVADGVYTGDGNCNVLCDRKDLALRSESGPGSCMIDCENNTRAFRFYGTDTETPEIDGFTIINCNSGSSSESGGAILCSNSSPTIRNCIVRNCYSRRTGGVLYATSCNPTLINCLLVNNEAYSHGGAIDAKTSTITLVNCTVAYNTAGNAGGGAHIQIASDAIIENCIIAHNTATQGNQISLTNMNHPSTLTTSYSAISGGQEEIYVLGDGVLNWGEGMVDDDPLFLDAAWDDFRLTPLSPCIDAGTNAPAGGLPEEDLNGVLRPFDGDGDTEPWTGQAATTDMGAFELDIQGATAVCTNTKAFFFWQVAGGTSPETQNLAIWNCGAGLMNWTITEECSWLTVSPTSGQSDDTETEIVLSVDPSGLEPGVYDYTLEIVAADAMNNPCQVDIRLAVGTERHVPDSYATIQEAIDAASIGDTVLVADGIYTGDGNTSLECGGKRLIVRSEHGPTYCKIDCAQDDEAFNIHEGEQAAVIDGFTIVNASGRGIACANQSVLTVRNCIVTDCGNSQSGGGVHAWESQLTLINCLIADNEANNGAGVSCGESELIMVNCTVARNTAADETGGVHIRDGSSAEIVNCVVAHNAAFVAPEIAVLGSNGASCLSVSYSDVLGGEAAVDVDEYSVLEWRTGNIADAPGFLDLENGDYRLGPGSPCVDAGTNTPPGGLPAVDVEGEPRPVDGNGDYEPWSGQYATADMGADELPEGLNTAVCVTPQALEFFAPYGVAEIDPQYFQVSNCGYGTLKWQIVEKCAWLSVDPTSGISTGNSVLVTVTVDPTQAPAGVNTCELEVLGVDAVGSPAVVTVTARIGDRLDVPAVYPTIQDAIDAATDGDQIAVADGVYTGEGNRALHFGGKNVTLRSQNGVSDCIIDCEHVDRAFTFDEDDTNVTVDGFMVVNGGHAEDLYGGGVYCEGTTAPKIRNCVFSYCTAASMGGAIYAGESDLFISNCLFCENDATHDGGAVFCTECTLTMVNCTVADNLAGRYGGGLKIQTESSASMTNCIVAYNTSAGGEEILLAGTNAPSTLVLAYSNVLGGTSAIGAYGGSSVDYDASNVDGDPLFADRLGGDYRLTLGSPCIDSGTNAPPGELPPYDIEGDVRPLDGNGAVEAWTGVAETADMGVDEFGPFVAGDFDGDQDLDSDDFALFLATYGTCSDDLAFCAFCDLDGDGCVTALDYQMWMGLYREFVNDPFAPPPGEQPDEEEDAGPSGFGDIEEGQSRRGDAAGPARNRRGVSAGAGRNEVEPG